MIKQEVNKIIKFFLIFLNSFFIDEVIKITSNINKLSEKIEWAKVALEEFRDLMSRGELTNQLIEKYCKEDASRAEVILLNTQKIKLNFNQINFRSSKPNDE